MPTINILQTYYKDEQISRLDSAFTPYNVTQNHAPHLREFPLYFDLFRDNKHKENDYTGIFSYKFNIKAKISGETFISFVRNNPGFDAYFINPYPQLSYLSYNIWEQGEYFHPGIKKLSDRLFSQSKYPARTNTHGRDTHECLIYSNYWIGNDKFWDRYISFLLKMHEATSVSKPKDTNPYLKETPYINPAPMYPFIFERLFTTFIKNEADLKYLPYPHTHEEIRACCNSVAELAIYDNIHETIDCWDSEKSYNSERRAVFMSLLSSTAEYEKLMSKLGTHPFI